MLHAQIYAKKNEKNEENWLFTPPLTIYKRTAIHRLPTARNSKTVSFFRRWQQCSSSFCIWSREPHCGGFGLTSGSKSKNSLKNLIVQTYNCLISVRNCLFWRRSRYMFLDSEPEGEFQLPRSGMPLKEKKRTATLLPATEKTYMFLSSSPSVTKGKPFFFSSVKGSVHSQVLTCKSSFDMLICACNIVFISSKKYMHACHAVPRRR